MVYTTAAPLQLPLSPYTHSTSHTQLLLSHCCGCRIFVVIVSALSACVLCVCILYVCVLCVYTVCVCTVCVCVCGSITATIYSRLHCR